MKEFIKNIKFVWKYAKSEKVKMIIYVIFSLFGIAFSILFPLLSARRIINLTSNNLHQFVMISIVVLACALINDTM